MKTTKGTVNIDKKTIPEQLNRIQEQISKEMKERFNKAIFYTIHVVIILFILFKFTPV